MTNETPQDADPAVLKFKYTNHRGETGIRTVTPNSVSFHFGSTEWHPDAQWLMRAYDEDKHALRDFAARDVSFL